MIGGVRIMMIIIDRDQDQDLIIPTIEKDEDDDQGAGTHIIRIIHGRDHHHVHGRDHAENRRTRKDTKNLEEVIQGQKADRDRDRAQELVLVHDLDPNHIHDLHQKDPLILHRNHHHHQR